MHPLPLPLLKPPPDTLGKFKWGLLSFAVLNFGAFAVIALTGPAVGSKIAVSVAALIAVVGVSVHGYRWRLTVWHDLAIALLLGGAAQGFSKVGLVLSLVFAWLTWAQLYGGVMRSILRAVFAEAMYFGVLFLSEPDAILSREAGQIIGVTMASIFSFALGTALARVQASEARFRALVQNASDLIVVITREGQLKYLSPPAEQAFGVKVGASAPKFVALAHPDDAAALAAALAPGERIVRHEVRLKLSGGQWRECEALISNQFDNPDIQGAVLNVRDVSERKAADAALRAREAQLQDARHEVEIAAQIQTALLPRKLAFEGFDVAALMLPATEVGGDYYDVLEVDDGLVIGIGDVSGHGLTAGLIMLMTQSVVSALVRAHPQAEPRELIRHLNRVLHENIRDRLEKREHMTLSLLRVTAGGRVTHAGAHEEILVWRARTRSVESIATRGVWLGAVEDVGTTTVQSEFQLEPGDVLVLHTDGITEARDGRHEEYGPERLIAHLGQLESEDSQRLCRELVGAVERWSPVRADDRSVVVLRYLGVVGAAAVA